MSWALFESEFLTIWRMSFLEKWQLANKFFVSEVDCNGNTLLSAKKDLKISFLENESTMYLLKTSFL